MSRGVRDMGLSPNLEPYAVLGFALVNAVRSRIFILSTLTAALLGPRNAPLLKTREKWGTPAILIPTQKYLLKFQHYDLGIRPQAQRRAPSSCAAGSEDLHLPDPA